MPDANSGGQLALVKIEDGAPVRLFDVPHSARLSDGIRWAPDAKACVIELRQTASGDKTSMSVHRNDCRDCSKSQASLLAGHATEYSSPSHAAER